MSTLERDAFDNTMITAFDNTMIQELPLKQKTGCWDRKRTKFRTRASRWKHKLEFSSSGSPSTDAQIRCSDLLQSIVFWPDSAK